uniref:BTB domain-containing protein n=1 Tax=Parastrongyloides trichosuri TaxID=131310 RepID=A0A0N4ZVB2_PARTI
MALECGYGDNIYFSRKNKNNNFKSLIRNIFDNNLVLVKSFNNNKEGFSIVSRNSLVIQNRNIISKFRFIISYDNNEDNDMKVNAVMGSLYSQKLNLLVTKIDKSDIFDETMSYDVVEYNFNKKALYRVIKYIEKGKKISPMLSFFSLLDIYNVALCLEIETLISELKNLINISLRRNYIIDIDITKYKKEIREEIINFIELSLSNSRFNDEETQAGFTSEAYISKKREKFFTPYVENYKVTFKLMEDEDFFNKNVMPWLRLRNPT